jgi:hypothetical protein
VEARQTICQYIEGPGICLTDSLVFAVDAMSLSWDGMFAYAFPPFRFLLQVLLKIKQSDCKIILIADRGSGTGDTTVFSL